MCTWFDVHLGDEFDRTKDAFCFVVVVVVVVACIYSAQIII